MSKGTKQIRAGRVAALIETYEAMKRNYEREAAGLPGGDPKAIVRATVLDLVIDDLKRIIEPSAGE